MDCRCLEWKSSCSCYVGSGFQRCVVMQQAQNGGAGCLQALPGSFFIDGVLYQEETCSIDCCPGASKKRMIEVTHHYFFPFHHCNSLRLYRHYLCRGLWKLYILSQFGRHGHYRGRVLGRTGVLVLERIWLGKQLCLLCQFISHCIGN